MKVPLAAVVCALLMMPILVSAAADAIPAGFAQTSIFASQTKITAGDSISLFTVLYNSSSDEFTADVVFTVDGTPLATKHISLASGETQTPSVSWVASAGSHTASAHLENIVSSSGKGASLSNDKADTITLTIAAPLPPSPTTQAINTVSSVIASSTPVVSNVAQKAYNSLEYLRENAVNTLQNQLAASSGAKPKGQVLGAATYNAPQEAATSTGTGGSVLDSIWRGILNGLLFVCNIQILFYGLFLIVIFIIYRLIRTWMQER